MTYEPADPQDDDLINLLRERDGQATRVVLRDGTAFTVLNIAWGYDAGDAFAHVTTNISPSISGQSIDFFFTSAVERVTDLVSGTTLFEDLLPDVDPGWRFVCIGPEGKAIDIGGVNPWKVRWVSLHERITVAHPQYPNQRHPMNVYDLAGTDPPVRFAAGEFSNRVWGFYLPG